MLGHLCVQLAVVAPALVCMLDIAVTCLARLVCLVTFNGCLSIRACAIVLPADSHSMDLGIACQRLMPMCFMP